MENIINKTNFNENESNDINNMSMNISDEKLIFKPLRAEDFHYYDKFYGLRHNMTCDSVSLESFLWKDYYNVKAAVARRDGEEVGLLWLMEFEGEIYSAMPLCKEENLQYCFDETVRYFNKELNRKLVINLADEAAIHSLNLPEERFLVREQEDLKDYLYDGAALRSLVGKKLHKKKNHYNRFIKDYAGRYEYKRLKCCARDDVFTFLAKWREHKGDDVEEHLDPEVQGVHEVIKNCQKLDIKLGGVYVDGKLEAFTIGSYNALEDMAVIHIEKANADISGLYQFINKEFLVNEFPEAKIINREDDLGIEGLRRAKESYYPIDYARKYYVEQLDFESIYW